MCIGLLVVVFWLVWLWDLNRYVATGYLSQPCFEARSDMVRLEAMLLNVSRVLLTYNVTWWLDNGALLGCIRNGTLIPWDKDIDVAILEDESYFLRSSDRRSLRPDLLKAGFPMYAQTVVYPQDFDTYITARESVSVKLEFYTWCAKDGASSPPALPRAPSRARLEGELREGRDPILRRCDFMPHASDSLAEKLWKYFGRTFIAPDVPASLLFPLRRHSIGEAHPAEVAVPNNSIAYLQLLYGASWKKEHPWKLSCYLP